MADSYKCSAINDACTWSEFQDRRAQRTIRSLKQDDDNSRVLVWLNAPCKLSHVMKIDALFPMGAQLSRLRRPDTCVHARERASVLGDEHLCGLPSERDMEDLGASAAPEKLSLSL